MKEYKTIKVEPKTHYKIKLKATKNKLSIMEQLKKDYERKM